LESYFNGSLSAHNLELISQHILECEKCVLIIESIEATVPKPQIPNLASTNVFGGFSSKNLQKILDMGVENKIETSGCRVYLDDLVRESGDPSDPVEIMLLEQTAMCHFLSMKLQSKASGVEGTEAIELYLSGAARLSSEFRKTALALKEYRKK